MIIRIKATDIPRDTVAALLGRTRNGLGEKSRLTAEVEGYYYAVVDHPDAVAAFEGQLSAMHVQHQQVPALPAKPKPSIRAFRVGGTGNARVDAAYTDYVVAVIEDLTAGVRGRRSGGTTLFS